MELYSKKILYICSRRFWPPKSGHDVKVYNYCQGLHDRLGCTVDLFVFDEKKENVGKPFFINGIVFSERITWFVKAKNLLFKSLFSKEEWPFQCSLYYSKLNKDVIERLINTNSYSAVIVDMIRLAPYIEAFRESNSIKILEMDDLLSKRYERQLKSLDKKTKIQGYYSPLFITKLLLNSKQIKKFVLSEERKRLRSAEKKYIEEFDYTTFASNVESEECNICFGTSKCSHLGIGVDYTYYSNNCPDEKKPFSAVFMGNMQYAANADSLRFIVKKVLPESRYIKQLTVVGECPEELIKEFSTDERVRFSGLVDDVRPIVKSHTIFLSPIAYGTGIKTKILEAMAMGIPVITNSVGAEGLLCTNKINILIEDSTEEISAKADLLIMNTELSNELAENAKKLVREHYNWDKVFENFSRIL